MWHAYELLAHDIIRERQREAAASALARRAVREVDTLGGSQRRTRTVRVGAPRRVLASVLRRVAAIAGSLAAAARGMAARLDGRVEGRVA